MRISEMLRFLLKGHPRRNEAAAALLDFLGTLAGRVYKGRVAADVQADYVQDVLMAVLRLTPLRVAQEGDGACTAYLARALKNRLVQDQRGPRARAREQLPEAGGAGEPVAAAGPVPVSEAEEHWTLLDRAFAHARDSREARYREGLTRDWLQVRALVRGEVEMRPLLEREEGLAPGASEAELKRVRDRVQQRHKRCREAVKASIDLLEASGALGPEDAAFARKAWTVLVRCQKR